MKKTIYITITLSMIALAAVFTFTNTTSAADRLLMENVEALADGCDSLQSFIENAESEGDSSAWCLRRDGTDDPAIGSFCTKNDKGQLVCKRLVSGPGGGSLATHLCEAKK